MYAYDYQIIGETLKQCAEECESVSERAAVEYVALKLNTAFSESSDQWYSPKRFLAAAGVVQG